MFVNLTFTMSPYDTILFLSIKNTRIPEKFHLDSSEVTSNLVLRKIGTKG